jgi:hypothetical protein
MINGWPGTGAGFDKLIVSWYKVPCATALAPNNAKKPHRTLANIVNPKDERVKKKRNYAVML